MDQAPHQSRVLKFGVFEVDLEGGELRKSGVRQKLTGQPFEVLRLLLERPQQVVTREELQKHLWPQDTFVDYDLAVKKAINRLREVLGDDAESPRFIETIPRRGYRFIAPVNANGDSAAVVQLPVAEVQQPNRGWKLALLWGIGASALVVAALGVMSGKLFWRRPVAGAAPEIRSLAVLPLQNLSNDPAQEYFSDGMTDALITDLAQIGSLKVISRTSSMQYKQAKKSLPEIARELNVDGIVEGTVQRSGDRVRITAQLIYAASDKHLWATSYERDVRDVFALERDIAGDVAHQVQARLPIQNQPVPPPTVPRPEQPRPVNLTALEAYFQGDYLLNRKGGGAGDEDTTKAAEYFQQAIDADPSFAPAYLGKARAYEDFYRQSSENLAIARKAAQRAVDLDPSLSDAWVELGDIHCTRDWDWRSAEQDYRRAIALNPNNAWARHELGDFLSMMGRLDEALKEYQLAQERDPTQDYLSLIIYLRGDHDHAIELVRKEIESHPNEGWSYWTLAQWLAVKGMHKESVQEMEKALTLFGFPEIAARTHRAFVTSGYQAALQEAAEQFEHLQATDKVFFPMTIAQLYAGIGDKDRAFYWLEQAYEHRDWIGGGFGLEMVRLEPMLDPLRSDPRFEDLIRRVGLPP
jgi:TolB-like protein/DNA-binding winged helix-turn-helix (wHTH) protein